MMLRTLRNHGSQPSSFAHGGSALGPASPAASLGPGAQYDGPRHNGAV